MVVYVSWYKEFRRELVYFPRQSAFETMADRQYNNKNQSYKDCKHNQFNLHIFEPQLLLDLGPLFPEILCLKHQNMDNSTASACISQSIVRGRSLPLLSPSFDLWFFPVFGLLGLGSEGGGSIPIPRFTFILLLIYF